MDKNIIWALALKNSVAILSWVILAKSFGKWWIALFALLFIDCFQTVHKNYRICDKCGKRSPCANSYNEALDKAKEAGWLHVADGNKDYCPDCKHKI